MNMHSIYRSPFAPRLHFDEAGAGAGGGDAAAQAAAAAAAAAASKPWYEGKADAETIGWLQNKGWDKDPVTAAIEASKARREAERFLGAPPEQLLRLPKDATDEAGWNAVRQRLGAPKEAREYDFSTVKFADGSELEQSFTDRMRAALHKAGTPKDAAPGVVKEVVGFMDAADAADTAAKAARLQSERTALQSEWGPNAEFNRLTAMQGAKRAVGSEEKAAEVISAMQDAIGYKATMEFWRKIGAGTSEDTFVESGHGGNPVTMNGAKARIEELKNDPEWTARYLKGMPKEKAEMDNLIMLVTGVAA